jgi:hypothetical protein
MGTRIRNHIRSNVVGYIALLLFATSGTAIALDGSDTVFSDDIVDGQVKSPDIGNKQIRGVDVRNNTLTAENIDWSSLDIVTGTGNAASCNDDQGTGSACVSTSVTTENIGAIMIHATGTWSTFAFDDLSGPGSGSDNPDRVQARCNIRFDGTQVGPVQELGEADASGAGNPTHPAGYGGPWR